MSLLTALIVKGSYFLAGIYFIFLKKRHRQKLSTKVGPQWKHGSSRYQVTEVLALFYKLVALILG